jgi:hypothetical protein
VIWHKNYIAPTREEKARNDRVMKMGCILSAYRTQQGLAVPKGKTELQHLIKPGKREGHLYTICLHVWYHRGIVPYPFQSRAEAREVYGASITQGSKAFLEDHGITQWDLWELTQGKLGMPAERPITKILPRKIA